MHNLLYGWDETASEWVKLRCDADGNLLVDVSELTFDVLLLNPQDVAPTEVEGGIYYDNVEKGVYVGVE